MSMMRKLIAALFALLVLSGAQADPSGGGGGITILPASQAGLTLAQDYGERGISFQMSNSTNASVALIFLPGSPLPVTAVEGDSIVHLPGGLLQQLFDESVTEILVKLTSPTETYWIQIDLSSDDRVAIFVAPEQH